MVAPVGMLPGRRHVDVLQGERAMKTAFACPIAIAGMASCSPRHFRHRATSSAAMSAWKLSAAT